MLKHRDPESPEFYKECGTRSYLFLPMWRRKFYGNERTRKTLAGPIW